MADRFVSWQVWGVGPGNPKNLERAEMVAEYRDSQRGAALDRVEMMAQQGWDRIELRQVRTSR